MNQVEKTTIAAGLEETHTPPAYMHRNDKNEWPIRRDAEGAQRQFGKWRSVHAPAGSARERRRAGGQYARRTEGQPRRDTSDNRRPSGSNVWESCLLDRTRPSSITGRHTR